MVSPLDLAKRALVSLLMRLASLYAVGLHITRDSPDAELRTAYRKATARPRPPAHLASSATTASPDLNVPRTRRAPLAPPNSTTPTTKTAKTILFFFVFPTWNPASLVQKFLEL